MLDARLSRAILVERYGEGVLKTLPRGKLTVYANAGGIDPDLAAGWFGFESGDAMVKALEAAPKRRDAIEAETDRVMNERHGDPVNDGSIEAIALQAVHGDRKLAPSVVPAFSPGCFMSRTRMREPSSSKSLHRMRVISSCRRVE